jgi:hypothetical protein
MNVRQIFLPLAMARLTDLPINQIYDKFDQFVLKLESTFPDFDEMTEWKDLSERERVETMLEFAIATGINFSEVVTSVREIIHDKG